jgi:hypothetical protein
MGEPMRASEPIHAVAGLTGVSGQLSQESWRSVGRSLADRRSGLRGSASRQMWEVGDWLVAGEDVLFRNLNRTRVRQLAAELTGYSRHTLTMAVSVARKVDASVRVDGLSWWHHLCVADRPANEQMEWLTRAAEEGWSIAMLRAELRRQGGSGRARRASPRRANRVVRDLLTLRREDLPEELLEQLRRWWDAGVSQARAL